MVGTVLSLWLFSTTDIRCIGDIAFGIPVIHWPHFTQDQITTIALDGMILGTFGSIDSLLTSVIADSLTRSEHKPNKELVGQGIG